MSKVILAAEVRQIMIETFRKAHDHTVEYAAKAKCRLTELEQEYASHLATARTDVEEYSLRLRGYERLLQMLEREHAEAQAAQENEDQTP